QVMGFKKSHAASFADRYEEYLMADSRYMQMFQAGRNAANIYSTEEGAGPRLLDNALEEWNKPKQKEEDSGPVTVLFTDIAGSTAMTQALGDAGAQQVVRIHNRVVREALSAHAGREVKHTGDGIMASFAKTSDSVDAAIQMQVETMKHNQAEPDLPLHLKIGMNAGEPIAEDNDLFGTVVQLSARIVDKASADEIYVSEIVRGICAGKSYKFKNLGGFPMKGFGDDITLFEVIWNENQAE
ncbi:MAG: adenylate/guanylate cyclase domain-containing protein, partial [Nitrospinaceae bacterium]|nr:adenylate/guanylate cyclase domain-containing protein [Nitrospinaceae bacterium]